MTGSSKLLAVGAPNADPGAPLVSILRNPKSGTNATGAGELTMPVAAISEVEGGSPSRGAISGVSPTDTFSAIKSAFSSVGKRANSIGRKDSKEAGSKQPLGQSFKREGPPPVDAKASSSEDHPSIGRRSPSDAGTSSSSHLSAAADGGRPQSDGPSDTFPRKACRFLRSPSTASSSHASESSRGSGSASASGSCASHAIRLCPCLRTTTLAVAPQRPRRRQHKRQQADGEERVVGLSVEREEAEVREPDGRGVRAHPGVAPTNSRILWAQPSASSAVPSTASLCGGSTRASPVEAGKNCRAFQVGGGRRRSRLERGRRVRGHSRGRSGMGAGQVVGGVGLRRVARRVGKKSRQRSAGREARPLENVLRLENLSKGSPTSSLERQRRVLDPDPQNAISPAGQRLALTQKGINAFVQLASKTANTASVRRPVPFPCCCRIATVPAPDSLCLPLALVLHFPTEEPQKTP
ncbi:hypothetical protein V8E36_005796 [Tilletia maclaganii]